MAGCLYIAVGISGSGKSKFAEFFCKATDVIELNADNYRKELGKSVNDQDINKVVFTEIDKAIESLESTEFPYFQDVQENRILHNNM